MRPLFIVVCLAISLCGCAAHEVYEKAGLNPLVADQDWASCEAQALNAAGQPKPVEALRGQSSASANRLTGTLAPLDVGNGTMYSPNDYLKIQRRRATLHNCMQAKGYSFVGVPPIEAL